MLAAEDEKQMEITKEQLREKRVKPARGRQRKQKGSHVSNRSPASTIRGSQAATGAPVATIGGSQAANISPAATICDTQAANITPLLELHELEHQAS